MASAQVKVGDHVRILPGAVGTAAEHIGKVVTCTRGTRGPGGSIGATDDSGYQYPISRVEYELMTPVTEVEPATMQPLGACQFLAKAADTIAQRGTQRDGAGEERSMARTVAAFNAMTNKDLTEEDGWLFMRYLKDSRSRKGNFTQDDYLDGVAYAALQAECADRVHAEAAEGVPF